MAWTNMGTKANGVVIDQGDWNQMVNNFAYMGGSDGNTTTGPLIPVTDNAAALGGVSNRWTTVYATNFANAAADLTLGTSTSGNIRVSPAGAIFGPTGDGNVSCGDSTHRWTTVYATTGAINTSKREAKQDFAPVLPAVALDVVRRTPILTYTYKVLPGRRFAGFLADDADPLLSPDHDTVDAGTTAAVCMAALQALDARMTEAGL